MKIELPKYPAYKPSGVEWAGEIPMDWTLIRLRYVASVKARLGWKGLTASEYVDVGNIFLSTPDIKGASIYFESANFITDERYLESPEIMLQIGDVLLVKDGATLGIVNLVRHLPGRATVNGSIAVIRTRSNLSPNFLFYFLKSHYLQNLIQQVKGGMGVPHLFQSDIVKFQLLIPRIEDQKQIITFLDRETAKIDRLMAVRRKQVERLQEQRTAVIHHAVTKGLDPQAKMKPSGVEWLGDIPASWWIYRLKFTARIKNGQDYKLVESESGYPVMGSGGQFAYANTYLHDGESVLFGRKGTINKPLYMNEKFWTVDTMFYTQIKPVITPKFLYHCAVGFPFEYYSTQTALPSMTQQDIGNHPLAIPALNEQRQIVDYIETETAKLDTLIAKYQRELELLAEYRASLISHAVTGKIDVRGLV